ncbi:serine hydrolase [Pontibacter silvestris]|uniref:beta-lactamase n=1 Tax=Pontibacter silvestris TaxID=2305183 RepID=A0ABW4WXY7_9BACT|nr:serine hydrolase [Pontibacter silvestris]MCC9136758.1 class A beta-lactamase-related serine hydrolase [Pontibacter silvestris]
MKKLVLVFILLPLYLITLCTLAQTSPKEILRQKVEKQLSSIVEASPAVTGLVTIDLISGERFAFNADVVFPQASAIKIPILMEVYKQAHQGKFKLSDVRGIKQENIVGGTGIIKDLADPAPFSIRNLSILMIALSDNTATNSLLDLVGLSNVNASLQLLGLEQTRVQRKMINAAASGRGDENISTPAEAARILQMLYKGEFVDKTISDEILRILQKTNRNDSRLAAGIPEHVPIAFKPGVLNGVSTEWAVVLLPERPYAVAIMENYKVRGKAEGVMEEASAVLYQYFWRLGNATRYGTYIDPALIR